MLDSNLVSSKVFKVLAAEHFVPSRDPDYSSSDSDSDDDLPQTLAGNKVINEQISQLLSNPEQLKQYQRKAIEAAKADYELAKSLIPNLHDHLPYLDNEHDEFLQELVGVKDPSAALSAIQLADQELDGITPNFSNLMQSVGTRYQQNSSIFSHFGGDNNQDANGWLNDLVCTSMSSLDSAQADPEMQQFMQVLGDNSFFNF
jgi:hypothetical protein